MFRWHDSVSDRSCFAISINLRGFAWQYIHVCIDADYPDLQQVDRVVSLGFFK